MCRCGTVPTGGPPRTQFAPARRSFVMRGQLSLPGFEFHDGIGFVYFGSRGGFIKIGYSLQDPHGRCKSLGLTPHLMISGTLEDEKALHKKFRRSHTDREWFINTP